MTEPWVPTSRTVTEDGATTTIEITTDLPTTLYLCTQPIPPVKNAIVVIRRGQPVICGFYLTYANPTCYLQTEPGATTIHTWSIPTPDNLSETWATATETSPPSWRAEQTVPFTLTPDVIILPTPHLAVARLTDIIVGDNHPQTVIWEAILWQEAWPYDLTINPANVVFPQDGYVLITYQVAWLPLANVTTQIQLGGSSTITFPRSAAAIAPQGTHYNQTAAWVLHVTAGQYVFSTILGNGDPAMTTKVNTGNPHHMMLSYLP